MDSIKITAGGAVLKENDRNPLVDRTHLSMTPFVGFSIDGLPKFAPRSGSAFGVPQ